MADRQPPRRGKGKPRPKREKPEFDQQIVDLARVTRVTKGGKQLSFRACVIIGDRKGRVGYGLQKAKDVQMAVEKAVNQAKKVMIRVPFIHETIPHRVDAKFGAGRVMIKPAPKGSGIIAGSSVRTLLELAGVPNASAKILSKTNNPIINLKAAFEALNMFLPQAIERARTQTTLAGKKEDTASTQKPAKNSAATAKVTKPAPKKKPVSTSKEDTPSA